MERYKLEIVNDHGGSYVRGEPATDGSWVMFKDVAALEARADRNAAGYARVDAEARRAEFLHKQKIAAMQKRAAKLEAALQRIAAAGGLFAEPASGQHAREIARAALEGGKKS